MPDTFDTLRPYLADYLRARGIDPRRCFRCLNPDRNPSMAYDARRHKVYCFAYDADYDPFDLFTIDHSCSSLLKALASASRLYGHGDVAVSRTATEPTRRAADGRGGECPAADPSHTERGDLAMSPEQIATYLGSCAEKRGQPHYFSSRGISEANAVRFSLGYDGVLDGKRYPPPLSSRRGHAPRGSQAALLRIREAPLVPRGRPRNLLRLHSRRGRAPQS